MILIQVHLSSQVVFLSLCFLLPTIFDFSFIITRDLSFNGLGNYNLGFKLQQSLIPFLAHISFNVTFSTCNFSTIIHFLCTYSSHHRRKAPLPLQAPSNPTPRTPKTVTIIVPLCEHTGGTKEYGFTFYGFYFHFYADLNFQIFLR